MFVLVIVTIHHLKPGWDSLSAALCPNMLSAAVSVCAVQ